jgi:hypothetical protein
MYVHWREREHEEVDQMVEEDPTVMDILKQCGMWKLFHCPFMRAQLRLLNHLIEYWNPKVEAFMLEDQSLALTIEDIYFWISLSRRGESMNLINFPLGPYNIAHYVDMYCEVVRKSRLSIPYTKD